MLHELAERRRSCSNFLGLRQRQLLKEWVCFTILLAADYWFVRVGLFLSVIVRRNVLPQIWPPFFGQLPSLYMEAFYPVFFDFVIPSIFIGFIAHARLYTRRLPFSQNAEYMLKACIYSTLVIILVLFLLADTMDKSRLLIFLFGPIIFCTLCVGRWITKSFLLKMNLWQRDVLMVGAGQTAEQLLNCFERDPFLGYRVIGALEDNPDTSPIRNRTRILGRFSDIGTVLSQSRVRWVIIAAPGLSRQALVTLTRAIHPYAAQLTIVPDLFGIPQAHIEIDNLFYERSVLLHIRNNLAGWQNRVLKRILDLVCVLLLLPLLLPLMMVIAIAIRLDSSGPAIFVSERVGRGKRLFPCLKFRTMHQNSEQLLQDYLDQNQEAAEEWNCYAKLKGDDPRVTRVGKCLRRWSLDELPQIVNVLVGTMSLVGPRPYLPSETKRIGADLETILISRPGITGYWQVNGRNERTFQERIEMDVWYIYNWSPWFDFMIMIRTIKVVARCKGAY